MGTVYRETHIKPLPPLLLLKYHAIAEMVPELGKSEEIGKAFAGFQKYLYHDVP